MTVFISYPGHLERIALDLDSSLKDAHFQTFFAPRDIPPAASIPPAIQKGIDQSDLFVVILDSQSFGENSWVNTELKLAEKKWGTARDRVITVIYDNTRQNDLPPFLKPSSPIRFQDGGNLQEKVRRSVTELASKRRRKILQIALPATIICLFTLAWIISPPEPEEVIIKVQASTWFLDPIDQSNPGTDIGFLQLPPRTSAKYLSTISIDRWATYRFGDIEEKLRTEGATIDLKIYLSAYQDFCTKTNLPPFQDVIFLAWARYYHHDVQLADKMCASIRRGRPRESSIHDEAVRVIKNEILPKLRTLAATKNPDTTWKLPPIIDSNDRLFWSRLFSYNLLARNQTHSDEFGPYLSTIEGSEVVADSSTEQERSFYPSDLLKKGSMTATIVEINKKTKTPPWELENETNNTLRKIPDLSPTEDGKATLGAAVAQWAKARGEMYSHKDGNFEIKRKNTESKSSAFSAAPNSISNKNWLASEWVRFSINDDIPEDNGGGSANILVRIEYNWGYTKVHHWLRGAKTTVPVVNP